MSLAEPVVQMVPIAQIHIQNPRSRNQGIFQGIVSNISRVGLKRPITVSRRASADGEQEFDLVCGQGRLEAYLALGEKEIPALVIEVPQEEQLLMSLVENVARRQYCPSELIREVRAQKQRGQSAEQIADKLDLDVAYIHGILSLLEHGEERLIREVENGRVALTMAIEIARADDEEVQRILCEAYEDKSLRGQKLRVVRRLIEERTRQGPGVSLAGARKPRPRPSKEALLRAYRQETQRQQLLVKKAQLTESRLLIIVSGLKQLLEDENFVTLLRAESLDSLPKYLAEKIQFGEPK